MKNSNHKLAGCYPGTKYRMIVDANKQLIALAIRKNIAVFGKNNVWIVYSKKDDGNVTAELYDTMAAYRNGIPV